MWMSVLGTRGPATCPACRREKYLVVKRRYGRRNKAKYEVTEKGKQTRAKALAKYRATPKARQTDAQRHQRTKDLPHAQRRRCHYCTMERKLTLDHVIPLSKGGQHTKANVVPACGPCNSKKRDRILNLF